MHKCEIFDRSDFHDFYNIKSLWGGDFGVKIKKFQIFRGSFRAVKFLTHMLSLILRRIFINGQKKIVVELLRPFFSINNDFIQNFQF